MHTINPKGEQSNLHKNIIKMVNLNDTNIHVTNYECTWVMGHNCLSHAYKFYSGD
jgi:hypothetical protein